MAENKKILLKTSAGDNLYPRASLDNLVDVVGGTTAVHVPTLDSDGHIESRFLPTGMSLLDSDIYFRDPENERGRRCSERGY